MGTAVAGNLLFALMDVFPWDTCLHFWVNTGQGRGRPAQGAYLKEQPGCLEPAVPLQIPPAMRPSTSSPALSVISLLHFRHPHQCVVASYCDINLHFPEDCVWETPFHGLICHLWIFG